MTAFLRLCGIWLNGISVRLISAWKVVTTLPVRAGWVTGRATPGRCLPPRWLLPVATGPILPARFRLTRPLTCGFRDGLVFLWRERPSDAGAGCRLPGRGQPAERAAKASDRWFQEQPVQTSTT